MSRPHPAGRGYERLGGSPMAVTLSPFALRKGLQCGSFAERKTTIAVPGCVSHRRCARWLVALLVRLQGRLPAGCRPMALTFLWTEHLAPLSPDRGEGLGVRGETRLPRTARTAQKDAAFAVSRKC